ncbi:MAG: hypothetical protein M1840_009065 [Geoglossum simile]|nr:MAG: hypothetical protein M1840_009065 [Geoglossum simile]
MDLTHQQFCHHILRHMFHLYHRVLYIQVAIRMEILDNIKNKLLDENWNLDTLCDERKGGAMTTAIWESYGFKLGTLANIRIKLSEFKQQRRPQSHDSTGNNSS